MREALTDLPHSATLAREQIAQVDADAGLDLQDFPDREPGAALSLEPGSVGRR